MVFGPNKWRLCCTATSDGGEEEKEDMFEMDGNDGITLQGDLGAIRSVAMLILRLESHLASKWSRYELQSSSWQLLGEFLS